jgi:hypothetical protein
MPYRRGRRWIGKVSIEGQQVHCGTHATRREALEAEAAAIRQRRRPGRTTVAGFAGRWKRDYKRPRASTNRTNAVMISTFVEEFGTRRLSSIDRLEARAWAQANPSRARTVRAMFNDAIDAGLVTQNPFARLGIEPSRGRRDLVVLSVMGMLGSQGCANKHSTTASSRPSERQSLWPRELRSDPASSSRDSQRGIMSISPRRS